jgi:hypothetical protein
MIKGLMGLLVVLAACAASFGIVFSGLYLGEMLDRKYGIPSIDNDENEAALCFIAVVLSILGGLLVGIGTLFTEKWKYGVGIGLSVHTGVFLLALWFAVTFHTSFDGTTWIILTGLIAGGMVGIAGVAVNRLRMRVWKRLCGGSG